MSEVFQLVDEVLQVLADGSGVELLLGSELLVLSVH